MEASQSGGQPTSQQEHDAAQAGAGEAGPGGQETTAGAHNAGEGQQGAEGGGAETEPHITGDQGEPAPVIEQDARNVGMVSDGKGGEALRQSAPPPGAQSGVPLEEDRQAGVEPGENSRNAAPAHEQPPVADRGGVVPGSQP